MRLRPSFYLLALLVLAAALRLWGLHADSLWADEIRTARWAAIPIGELASRVWVEHDLAVPVLHVLVSKLALFCGFEETGLRIPSVVFGVLGIAAVYVLGREAYGEREGRLAAFLLAVSHAHLYYSREARPYTLLLLLVTLLTVATLVAARRPSLRSYGTVAVLVVLAAHTHFLAVFPLAVCVGVLVARAFRNTTRGKSLVLGLAVVALVPLFAAVLASTELWQPRSSSAVDFTRAPVAAAIASLYGTGSWAGFAVTLLLVVAGLLATAPRSPWFRLASLQVLVPVVALAAIPFGHGFAPRYLLFLLPLVVVLQARGLTRLAETFAVRRRPVALANAAFLMLAAHAPAWTASFVPHRRDWRAAGQEVLAFSPRDTVVLTASTHWRRPVRDPSLECLGFYLGDPDGFSMPGELSIVTAGVHSEEPLDLAAWIRERPVVCVLRHDARRVLELPEHLRAVRLRGLTVLTTDDPEWTSREQGAVLLSAAAELALLPAESLRLLRGSSDLLRSAKSTSARTAAAASCVRAFARGAARLDPFVHARALSGQAELLATIESLTPPASVAAELEIARHQLACAFLARSLEAGERGDRVEEETLLARARELGLRPNQEFHAMRR